MVVSQTTKHRSKMQLNSILKKRFNWKDLGSFQTINNINRLSAT